MSGYTPLFSSIATGTLYGRWPDIGLWAIVLSQADKNGVLDVTPQYLAGVTGLPVDDVERCMGRFCQPDQRSRTKDHDGARLVLIDPENRNWGWRVVNHGKYREKARLHAKDSERTASGKDAERKRLERRPPMSPGVPLSDTDTDRREKADKPTRSARGSRLPEDFKPDTSYALQQIPDLDVAAEAQRFTDYWRSRTGSAAVKADWQATWRNWIRSCKDSGRYAHRARGGIHAGVVMR